MASRLMSRHGAISQSVLSRATTMTSTRFLQLRSLQTSEKIRRSGKTWERSGLVMTRIVCTIGPSSEAPENMQQLADEGMKIGRFNFSHAVDYGEMAKKVETLRGLGGAHRRVGISFNLRGALLDTKGPEIRSGSFASKEKSIEIPSGAEIILTTDTNMADKGTVEKIYVDYPSLAKTVSKGSHILLDDGIIRLEVIEPAMHTGTSHYTETLCKVLNKNSVTLGTRKGINIPGAALDLPPLTERDKTDLQWGIDNDVDFVAASFIRKASDVRTVIAHLERLAERSQPTATNPRCIRPLVISKIENAEAVNNFDEILRESDGIMVARGDLGVEIPFQDVFVAQKMMVKKCNDAGKPVIVATQMMDSMIRNPRPTRAEVSDVGNAVLDGADCVMLSAETAAGKYPVESVQAMTRCIVEADHVVDDKKGQSVIQRVRELASRKKNIDPSSSEELDTVAMAAVLASSEVNADLIITLTRQGTFARAIAKYRPQVPVMCFCTEIKVARQLQIHRGLFPVVPPTLQGASVEDIPEAIRTAKEIGWIRAGDKVVVANYELWDYGGIQQSMNLRVFRVH